MQVRRGDTESKEDLIFPPLKLAETALEETKEFKEHLPLVHVLCNPGLRQRHWDKVKHDVNAYDSG